MRSNKASKPVKPRAIAVAVIDAVVGRQLSLRRALEQADIPLAEAPFVKELCFGVLRWYLAFDQVLAEIVHKPLRYGDVRALIYCGFYQLAFMRAPDYAVVHETVSLCRELHKPWAEGVVNAALRRFIADKPNITAFGVGKTHPKWLVARLTQVWGKPQTQRMLGLNQQRPPLTLRVNPQRASVAEVVIRLAARPLEHFPYTVVCEQAINAREIDGFDAGDVSVQDAGAQLAAVFLAPKTGDRILDACAAPGGKTLHILELAPTASVLALDVSVAKCAKVQQNLKRGGVAAACVVARAEHLEWWDGALFDRILVDAPCSGTGVIRRNPDIRLQRRPEDIAHLAAGQLELLHALWQTLRPGGMMLYVTCSIMPEENQDVVAAFMTAHSDCQEVSLAHPLAVAMKHGIQLLPAAEHDGFYFAGLRKVGI
jgi:16S rRNA (cytosine967-C5)-methyltransferase